MKDKAPSDRSSGGPRSLEEIVDALQELGRRKGPVSVGDLVETLGRASGVSILLVAAAIATTPLSGIPGLSGFCGLVILVTSAQMFFGRTTIWLPPFMRRRSIPGDRLERAIGTLRKSARFLDRHTRERWTWFVRGPGKKLIQALCMVGGSIMPVLELIPFSASVVGGTVSLFAVALLSLDGLWAIFGFAVLAGGATALVLLI